MTEHTFALPESFVPEEFLTSPKLWRRQDDARYFISLILTKTARRDVDERGLVRLHAKHLESIMYQETYSKVIAALRLGGAVERFPYQVGEKSFGFRLSARFVGDKHVRVPATDRRLIARLNAFHAQAAVERDSRMKPVHRVLAERQTRLQIHGDEARRILAELPSSCNPFDVQGTLISDIERGEFHCNVGRYGRFTNNITSLKRELRDTLHAEGEPLASVDIACAQPALLGKIIATMTTAGHEPTRTGGRRKGGEQSKGKYDPSVQDFLSLVQSGQFYDFMAERLRESGISREEFKRRFLCDVLAKKGRYPSEVETVFRELFPPVYRFIRDVNRDGREHANLVRRLQSEEAGFVIETVAADLVQRHRSMLVVTLHDAIFTTVNEVPNVVQAFHRGFERNGFQMSLKIA